MTNPFARLLTWLQKYFFFAPALNYYGPVVDISKWQGDVDFAVMRAAGVELVLLRLSIGNETDSRFAEYYAAARAERLLVGVYHVVKPSVSVATQWTRIIDSLAGRAVDVFALDCELTDNLNPSTVATCIEALINQYAALYGEYPVLYTRALWWNAHTIYKPSFKLCPLWIARYWSGAHPWNDDPDTLKPRDWNDFALWQYSADGNGLGAAYGVSSDDIDLNHGNADDLAGLMARLHGLPPPAPGDDEMKPIKCTCPGDYLFVRVKPITTATTGGKFYRNATAQTFPAQTHVVKPDLPNKEIWLPCLLPDNTLGWVAQWHPVLKDAQGHQVEAVQIL